MQHFQGRPDDAPRRRWVSAWRIARRAVATALPLVLLFAAAPTPSFAQSFSLDLFGGTTSSAPRPESDWVETHNARVRLIGSGHVDDARGAHPLIGLEIELAPGWKTYWRSPGDGGGVPPRFDFARSQNLADTEVLYPTPVAFHEMYGTSFGYKNRVIFPIRLTASDPRRAIDVRLALSIGVCEDICIPVDLDVAITMPGDGGRGTSHLPALMAAVDRVPVAGGGPVALADVRMRDDAGGMVLAVDAMPAKRSETPAAQDLQVPDNNPDQVALYIEAEGYGALPLAKRMPEAHPDKPGMVTFETVIDGETAAMLKGRELRLTFATAGGGSSFAWRMPQI